MTQIQTTHSCGDCGYIEEGLDKERFRQHICLDGKTYQQWVDYYSAPQTPQEPRRAPRRWEEVLAPSFTSEPASERSQRLPRPRWLDRAGKDMTGSLKVDR